MLSNLVVKQRYQGNGSGVDFAIPQQLMVSDTAEVLVYVRDETDPLVPVTTLKVYGALNDYTLTGAVPPTTPFNNNVRFNVAPTANQKVIIYRLMPLTQILNLLTSGTFDFSNINLALDRIVAMLQQLDEASQRSAKFPLSSGNTGFDLPVPIAGYLIGFNAANTGFDSYDPVHLVGTSALDTHINNPTGAHAASAISNTPSGNLAASDVQAALNELQSDLDTRSPITQPTQFTLANNQAASDVTGLLLDQSLHRAVEIVYTIERRTATQGYRSFGKLIALYDEFAAAWSLEDAVLGGSSGATTGVTFTITAGGQIQYATDNMAGGTYVGKLQSCINFRFAKET